VDQEPDLARAFGVMSIPTVVFLKNGREVDRKIGLMPEAALEAALKQHL
jgi:thioredoxin 1